MCNQKIDFIKQLSFALFDIFMATFAPLLVIYKLTSPVFDDIALRDKTFALLRILIMLLCYLWVYVYFVYTRDRRNFYTNNKTEDS